MQVSHGRDDSPAVPGTHFAPHIGDVQLDAVLSAEGVFVNEAYYGTCARTSWHTHDVGQLILVAAGKGVVVTRDGETAFVGAGDVIHTPAGEEHWHGAAPDTFFTYKSISLGGVQTLAEVSDAEYSAVWEG